MATIAVVDDVAANRELFAVVLTALGHRVVEAADGAAALGLVRHERPALVVCDILMPVADGYEFVRGLRADPRIAATPVIFCSAHYLEREAQELAAACGVAHILFKPCDPEDIVHIVTEVLDGPAGAGPAGQMPDPDFDRRHLRLVTAKLSEKVGELEHANVELEAHAQALEAEIVEREATQQHLTAQYAVARLLEQADDSDRGVPRLLKTICITLGFAAGSLWRVDEESQVLRCVDAWCRPGAACDAFLATSRKLALRRGSAIPGRVWASGAASWLRDLPAEPDFLRREIAARAGLRSGGAFPIVVGGRVAGVIDVFSATAREPDVRLTRTLGILGNQIGQCFERKTQRQRILRLTRLYAVLSGINSAIVRLHDRGELFREACRIATGEGEFVRAWVGEMEPSSQDPRIVASAPAMDGDPAGPPFSPGASVAVRRAVAEAGRSGLPVHCNDLSIPAALDAPGRLQDPRWLSFIALPLLLEGRVVAVVGLHAREAGFFTGEELALLKELASDLSFALEYIAKQELLAYLARHDLLTGLPNRTELHDGLCRALHAARRHPGDKIGVVLWNVDRFHGINDTFGRRAGDAVLRELARRFSTAWPEADSVMRVGGDHFATVASGAGEITEIAHLVEQTAAAAWRQPIVVDGRELRVSMSAGIAIFQGGDEDAETLIKNAEAALRKAKRSGLDYVFYGPEMNARVAETLMLENKLRQAMEQEAFELHYQPKVDCASGRVTGVEALIRWNDPDTGRVSPARFIPILEETGMILPVGLWVLRRVLADAERWRAAGVEPPRIAVNVSAIQLQQADFVASVKRVLGERGDEEPLVDLEITESMIMSDLEDNVARLAELRGIGIEIAIDDFGTGYSSLGYLTRLPVTALKIDRSFVAAMPPASDNLSIVSTIISLAHSLQLKVIAEGVEVPEQAKVLREFRCNELQGYLISRPVPFERAVGFGRGRAIGYPQT